MKISFELSWASNSDERVDADLSSPQEASLLVSALRESPTLTLKSAVCRLDSYSDSSWPVWQTLNLLGEILKCESDVTQVFVSASEKMIRDVQGEW